MNTQWEDCDEFHNEITVQNGYYNLIVRLEIRDSNEFALLCPAISLEYSRNSQNQSDGSLWAIFFNKALRLVHKNRATF